MTEVVVTGLGATTPLGGDVASTWEALVAGRSGVHLLEHEGAKELPCRIAAELVGEGLTEHALVSAMEGEDR